MNDLQKSLKNLVAMYIADEEQLTEGAIDGQIDEIRLLPKFAALSSSEVDEVRASIKSEFSIKLDKGILIQEKGHAKWFLARKSSLNMKYWERYRKYLLADKGFSTRVVNTMDDVLDTLTDLLGDPTRDVAYSRKGLIIGDVQSGKTANYTGLICKAVDAGYKVVVLLTGTIEKLRQQTQQRIDEGFVGASSDAMMKQKEDGLIIGVGQYDTSIRPMVLTSTADDFKSKNASNLGFDLNNINGPVIFVLKKNSAVLKRLNKWLKTFNQNGTKPINHTLLVIDDESDNASVNTKKDPDETPTAINGQIRELLAMFSKSSYVGFTATPFANIFIDPDTTENMATQDLFPRDYIYSLNAPSNYTGARDIFGETGNASNMLVSINDDDTDPESIAAILPLKHKSSSRAHCLPKDMKTAIATFVLANVLEDQRGKKNNHRSMLINVSRFTDVQDQVALLVNDYLKEIQTACKNYCLLPTGSALHNEYIKELYDAYNEIYSSITVPWSEIQPMLYSSCAGIIVQTFNIRAGQNVNYEDYKDGLRIIAVGGMSLSRGLTLEGLVVSYFYRNSKMYDTLMQMGRWFGYRNGYEDLCKIWMSSESVEWYRHISQATDELREEIKRYEDTGLTPMDFGLRVRSDITSLLVTARNKMRSAESRECVISLSGVCIETPEIYSDSSKNQHNLEVIRALIKQITDQGYCVTDDKKKGTPKYGFNNIPAQVVIDFLSSLDISPKNEQFNVSAITRFIKDYRGSELKQWDIAFATGKSKDLIDLGCGIKYNYPTRSYSVVNDGNILKMSGSKRRLGTSSDGQFGLSDQQIAEVKDDCKERGIDNPSQKSYFVNTKRNPLLTIYAVELTEEMNGLADATETRDKKYAGQTVFGFGVGIPSLADQETKYARYVLNKVAIQQIFDGDVDWDDDDEGDD